MSVEFSFAHFSDPHLPLPDVRPPLRMLLNKRLPGWLSWHRARHAVHRREVLDALQHDVAAHGVEHTVITGDLVNVSLPEEFAAARRWLAALGDPAGVTVVPGNHDQTVAVPWEQGLGQWRPWMSGDDGSPVDGAEAFPFVRLRGPVAFVGLSTAVPTPVFMASGRLGSEQLKRTESVLADLGRRGLFRVVALHHPPLDSARQRRTALVDRGALQACLARAGAELVVHGHRHRSCLDYIAGPEQPIPVVGAPSASAGPSRRGEMARWHLFRVRRTAAGWQVTLAVRGLAGDGQGFEDKGGWTLTGLPAVSSAA